MKTKIQVLLVLFIIWGGYIGLYYLDKKPEPTPDRTQLEKAYAQVDKHTAQQKAEGQKLLDSLHKNVRLPKNMQFIMELPASPKTFLVEDTITLEFHEGVIEADSLRIFSSEIPPAAKDLGNRNTLLPIGTARAKYKTLSKPSPQGGTN